jgi:hypothetical protein
MLTMDEYKVVDKVLPNYLEEGDLIKVKGDVFEITNIIPTHEGWDIFVIDNYNDPKTISVSDDARISIVLSEYAID